MHQLFNKITNIQTKISKQLIYCNNKLSQNLSNEQYIDISNQCANLYNLLSQTNQQQIINLLNLPRAIPEDTDTNIGQIINIPYIDTNNKLLLNNNCIEFEVVGVNHHKLYNYIDMPTITLMTKNVIRTAAFDAKEPNNPDNNRKTNGNNRWGVSNIRQWLNSNNQIWFTPQHEYDTQPNNQNTIYNNNGQGIYSNDKGFLYGFNDKIKNHFALIKNKTYLTDIDKNILNSDYEETLDYVFLPSTTQLGCGNPDIIEGNHLNKKFINQQSLKKSGKASYYFTRSIKDQYTFANYFVNQSGITTGAYRAYYGDMGISPIIVLF